MRWPTAQARPCIRRDLILPVLRREATTRYLWTRARSRANVHNTISSFSCSELAFSDSADAGDAAKGWRRWASSRSTVRIPTKPRSRTVLPQGLLKADDRTVEKADDEADGGERSATAKVAARNGSRGGAMTVIDQVEQNMRKFENCVVLTRIGDFYELYFEHAQQYGPLLGLKVATKSTVNGDVAMSGFPHFHLDRYLKILVQDLNCYVALSNQFLNDVEARLNTNRLYDRRVVRVITPGTLIDENFMDPTSNNFCLAIYVDPEKRAKTQAQQRGAGREAVDDSEGGGGEDEVPDTGVAAGTSALNKLRMAETELGLAWLDLSTGEFYTQKSTYAQLSSLLTRIGPKEIVLSHGLQKMQKDVLLDILGPEQQIVTWQEASTAALPLQDWQDMLDSPMPERVAKTFSPDEIRAGSMVLKYVKTRLQEQDTRLQPPIRRLESESMIIDRHTLRGLEVLKTLRDSDQVGAKGSLLHACRRTQTAGGARLLRERMTRPSTVLSVIEGRLDLVEELLHRPKLCEDVRASLRQTFDMTRLVQKFSIGRGEPDDLINMSRTISLMQSTSGLLKADASARALCQLGQRFSLEEPIRLSERISKAIDEQGLLASQESEEAEASAVTSTAQGILASKGSMEDVKAYGLVARAKTLPSNPKLADSALNDDGGGDKWTMQKDASPTLSQLHSELATLRRRKTDLVETLRRQTGADSLTLHWNPRYGYHGHVNKKRDVAASSEHFARTIGDRGTQRATRSFHVPEWEELGKEIDNTRLRIVSEERKVFVELRDEVVGGLVHLRRNAAVLDELDVACSSAVLAQEQGAVRPTLDEGRSLVIVGGRHPTVTLGLEERGRRFVENDCFMNTGGGRRGGVHADKQPVESASSASDAYQQPPPSSLSSSTSTGTTSPSSSYPASSRSTPPSSPSPSPAVPTPPSLAPPPSPSSHGERIHLITGPNMAGKSTYLRQNALLTLMAQVGLFLPATAAHIGLVDALFARIGSADNLFSDQSTFMTEMLETAAILRGATDRSLVVMDEVGRGTTPEDGFAVAWAALWHLVSVNRCRALFASHFHGLADAVLRGLEDGQDQGEGEGWWDVEEQECGGGGGDGGGGKKRKRPAVGLYCTDVKELEAGAGGGGGGGGGFVFLHKVRPGVNRRSHALKVAGMAGLPGPALEMARRVLKQRGEGKRL